jgi:hypothetical protein
MDHLEALGSALGIGGEARTANYLHKGPKKKKLKPTYIWQMASKWGRSVPSFFLIFLILFYGVFVRFSTRGVQKHQKQILAEKVERKKKSCRISSSALFYRVFGRFSA